LEGQSQLKTQNPIEDINACTTVEGRRFSAALKVCFEDGLLPLGVLDLIVRSPNRARDDP
jgi:hypothetical protein